MLKAICSHKELTDTVFYMCVDDIIDSPELERLKGITHHISTTRFQHCLNVSYYGYQLCRLFHLDARSAARAGLLHDLFYYDRKRYNSSKTKGQPSHSKKHSDIALRNARLLTDISPKEQDIIQKHMWPVTTAKPSYKETYIITFVDKYCAVLEFCVPKVQKIIRIRRNPYEN
ncbi:MAG: HD domain-containing protein [Ruminococcus flavefaciens]|nr:HD domain-containing protein [Ruminococcus flavefaciens]MCM1229249.1 HD domain-containing protein [Ruminococcus flavefaciens]